jgi:hypothetical protein
MLLPKGSKPGMISAVDLERQGIYLKTSQETSMILMRRLWPRE